MVEVRFRWERSFDRSYCHKKVGTDGNPFENYKTDRHRFALLSINHYILTEYALER
jgi:hypothetical protein